MAAARSIFAIGEAEPPLQREFHTQSLFLVSIVSLFIVKYVHVQDRERGRGVQECLARVQRSTGHKRVVRGTSRPIY